MKNSSDFTKSNLIKFLSIFILLISVSFLNISGCGDGDGDTVTKTIGPEGGTIESKDGIIRLEIPAGALDEDTEISLERFNSIEGDSGLILIEFQPDGQVFLVPANLTVDISDSVITGEDQIEFSQMQIIFTVNEAGELEALENLTLDINDTTGEATLSGDVNHFSRFVSGISAGVSAVVEGVPFMHPANTPFTAELVVLNSRPDFQENPVSTVNGIQSIFFRDSSIAPVLFEGEMNPITTLRPVPGFDQTETYDMPYACGPPGEGEFKIELSFTLRGETPTLSQLQEEAVEDFIEGVFFGFGGTFGPLFPLDTAFINLSASRNVMCVGEIIGPPPPPPPPEEMTSLFPLEDGNYNGNNGCGFGSTSLTADGNDKILSPLGSNSNTRFNASIFDIDGTPIAWSSTSSSLFVQGEGGHTCRSDLDGSGFRISCNSEFESCIEQFSW